MRSAAFVAVLSLLGCPSEVRVEGPGGAATDGPSATTATTTNATTATSATMGTGTYDVQAGCVAACDNECVAGPNTCLGYCLESAADAPACEREAVAASSCNNQGCIPGNDCEAENDALYECMHISCESWACTETPTACTCSPESCEGDHTRRASCVVDAPGNMRCDCYEDDVLVNQCITTLGCAGHVNCCRDILEN